MKIHVLQHVYSEHPGRLSEFLREDGLSWDTIELDEGQEIPDLEPYDLMIVMGGPKMCGRKISTLGYALRRRLSAHSSWTCGGHIWGCALDTSCSPTPSEARWGPPKRPRSAC